MIIEVSFIVKPQTSSICYISQDNKQSNGLEKIKYANFTFAFLAQIIRCFSGLSESLRLNFLNTNFNTIYEQAIINLTNYSIKNYPSALY